MEGAPSEGSDLDKTITLLFMLKRCFSLGDNDLRGSVMNALLGAVQKMAPDRFRQMQSEWRQQRFQDLREAHAKFQAHRTPGASRKNQ